jgi:hypothetical protein
VTAVTRLVTVGVVCRSIVVVRASGWPKASIRSVISWLVLKVIVLPRRRPAPSYAKLAYVPPLSPVS